MSAARILSTNAPPWYTYLVVFSLGPIGLFMAYKVIFGYKVIRYGNNQIEVRVPVLGRNKIYPLNKVDYWSESIVKTGKHSTFKELEIKFMDNKKIRMGLKEYSEYSSVIQYLEKKLARKKRKL